MSKLILLSALRAGSTLAVAAAPRAMCGPIIRAEAQSPEAMLAQINAAVTEMRSTFETQISARVPDVLFQEKINALQGTIDTLEGSLTAINARLEASALGNNMPGDMEPTSPEYIQAFRAHMRTGNVNAAMSVGTATEGGYLAPVEWDRTLTPALQQLSPLRNYAQVMQLGQGTGFSRLYSTGQPGSGWVGETAARPATSTPVLATLNFAYGELYANPAITQQALDDVALDLEGWLNGEVATEFARQEGIAFLSGDGSNKPHGILTYVESVGAGALGAGANAARHPLGAIEAIATTGGAGEMSADDVLNLMYELPEERAANARLFVARSSVRGLRLLKDQNGQYLWANPMASTEPATFNGAPITTMNGMPSTGAGATVALYGDMRATYLIIDRIGVRVLRDPFTNKPFVHFYTTRRVGGGVQNPEFMRALRRSA